MNTGRLYPPAPPRSERPATEPTPRLNGAIGLRELQHARRLLSQGLELDRVAQSNIVQLALELVSRADVRHDETCGVWRSQICDCPEGGGNLRRFNQP